VEWGGEPMLAVGFTAGGAPYGSTIGEFRRAGEEMDRRKGWAIAKRALVKAARRPGGEWGEPEVGRVTKIGEGLSRDVFAASVDPPPEGAQPEEPVVLAALVPRRPGGSPQPVRREARLLRGLERVALPFRVPRFARVVETERGAVLVLECLAGIPADLRAGRTTSIRPWELVAEVAAGVHAVELAPLAAGLGGWPTRRAHGQARLGELAWAEAASQPMVRAALAWLCEHLPPDEPARLLHGDLLGQNILLWPGSPPALIDWEHALRGDPAYDLAIVTRGVRHPFQIERGLPLLLEAYARHGGCELGERDVRFHEIALHVDWYRRARRGERTGQPVDQVLPRLRNLLRAVE